ncbi:MAG: ectonucleotide pyrophosphatase/phosphodiesterase [Cytobacillus gottheilii]|uniref:alkaline phosphatase family protein n=1 Tax=Cytobacillus gottheilii TaxID=859144 RepID=UPI003463B84D
MKRLTKKMVVISFDCLAADDFSQFSDLPNFKRVLEKGSYAENVESIYPSVTYPCHTTIVTGRFPARHGIMNNTLMQPGWISPDWHWYRKDINGTTLYDEAYKANLSTAALLWPVTGRAKNIQYNLPEIFPNRPWQNQVLVSLFSGSPLYQLELNNRFGHIRNGLNQPELDDFVLESAVFTLKEKKPDIMLIHFTDLDTQRHVHGVHSKEAEAAIERHDRRLGALLDAIKESGAEEETTIILLGDHSAIDVNRKIHLNVLLREHNLIEVDSKGRIANWKAYCHSCDGSAYIYLRDDHDHKTASIVKKILEEQQEGIEFILTGEEAGERGADPRCTFMLEAQKGYYFAESINGDHIEEVTAENLQDHPKNMLACHGFSPSKPNYTTFFLAAGKGILPNQRIPYMHLTDIGPTLAQLLGLDLGDTDGQVIDALLTD